ncbi:MAG: cbb3-type cytochrome c oxidase subunit I, partial [Candidatus Solibacter usitatus]|nr:cbb3-type cytochrome c oxidase subunit I [Candidatus Solibacter usitatus]
SFLRRYVFSTDHKVIGIQYLITAMFMAIAGGGLVALMRMQLAWPGTKWAWLGRIFPDGMESGVMKPEFYLSLMTMHGTIMVFFVVSLGLLGGFGNFLIPLQIGARDMAFPVLNMLSYWTIVPACLVMLGSFWVEGGAAAAGWTAYPPLSAVRTAVPGSQWGQTLWILGMALFIASFTMGGLNYVTTIFDQRTKGMSMMRMPLTIWTMFIASAIGLLAFPPLLAAAVLLLFDRHGGTSFFLPSGLYFGNQLLPNSGGTPLLWQHLFWFLGHPEVYVLILPALGITLDLLPVFTRKPLFGYRLTVYCLYAIAALSMIVWGHHMYVSGMSPYVGEFFAIGTLAITVPSTIIGVNMIASLWGGTLRFPTPMLFVIGAIVFFGTGGFGGIFLGNATSDIQLHDTYFVVGHFHLMIGGVTLMAMFAGVYYWFPKMFGRMMSERLGKVHFWLTFPAFYAIFLAMHYQGLAGMPRRYYAFDKYEYLQWLQGSHLHVSLAAFLLFGAQFLFLYNFFRSLFRGRKAADNPWNAATLEWSSPTPAPHGNWGEHLPEVHRWPYDYSVPGATGDCTPQTTPASVAPVTF